MKQVYYQVNIEREKKKKQVNNHKHKTFSKNVSNEKSKMFFAGVIMWFPPWTS